MIEIAERNHQQGSVEEHFPKREKKLEGTKEQRPVEMI
jgi:hypothetical protein